ncbi:MAG: aconitate hydratase, partial [Clostridiales bacterium]|nr:aconitate hydratase [Clostridiales bacterium]
MAKSLTYKILESHIVSGDLVTGNEIAIKIDQTLTQDSTGTMAYLQLEALEIPKVRTKRSVAYIDHNTLQTGVENADDHAYITGVAGRHGIYVSRAGNGICHQVHLERFGVPGETLLGSDSHTPTGGGIGMLAIGAGGLDVAVAMGGGAYYLNMPRVINIVLTGKLKPYVAAKDIILAILKRLTVKGGVGKVIEYSGEGVSELSVPERATITNMGAELGATASVFPSDENTKAFLAAQGRVKDFTPLAADPGALYDEIITINLSNLTPLAACPHSPDAVKTVGEIGEIKVDQVCIGSCTNSSYLDMMRVAAMLRGKEIAQGVSLTVSPGSRQVLEMLAASGALRDMIAAGARILECACGPCIGMGQSPKSGAVSVRTFNRNFFARSGTASAQVYLTSCETAAATALNGVLTDPTTLKDYPYIEIPKRFTINDNLIIDPASVPVGGEIIRGDNIKPFPRSEAMPERLYGKTLIVLGDNITTDHIMPSTAKLLPYRSNIPYLSDYCLQPVDPDFPERARASGGGFIAAGSNYGQGSSREHAALVPLYLKIKGVIAKSFARIHKDNLINNGILPLEFKNAEDYALISAGDGLLIEDVITAVNAS